jgi:hypothetical protein
VNFRATHGGNERRTETILASLDRPSRMERGSVGGALCRVVRPRMGAVLAWLDFPWDVSGRLSSDDYDPAGWRTGWPNLELVPRPIRPARCVAQWRLDHFVALMAIG